MTDEDGNDWWMAGSSSAEDQPVPPGPPEDLVPSTVALDLVLAQSPEAAVYLTALRAYPTGIDCLVEIRVLEGSPRLYGERGEEVWRREPGGLRWGASDADGSAAQLDQHSHGGSERSVTAGCWWYPLPPPGPVTVWCEWPDRGIVRTEQTIDGALFHDAVRRCRPLWLGEPGSSAAITR